MHARRMTTLLAAAGLVLALGACSDDSGDEPKGSPSTSTGTAEPSASSSDSASGTDPGTSPSVEAATGELISLRSTATVRLPADVEWDHVGDGTLAVTIETIDMPEGADDYVHIDFSEFPQINDDLARMAQTARDSQEKRRKIPLEVAANRTVGGVEGYVLEGEGAEGQYYEWGGLDADNVLTVLSFIIPNGLDVAQWVEPVLASLEWK